jgi:hypothetical protein
MITALAPLGATHMIVLSLAYGDAPPTLQEAAAPDAPPMPQQTVTITAYLKPKDGKKGEPKTLQFEGPVPDVEARIATDLPVAVSKITHHVAALEQLDAELAAEQEKKRKENESKKNSPGVEVTPPKGVKSRTVYPSKTAKAADKSSSRSKAAAKAADTRDKKRAAEEKPTGAAAEALAKVRAAAEKGKAAAEQQATPESDQTVEQPASLEELAKKFEAAEEPAAEAPTASDAVVL